MYANTVTIFEDSGITGIILYSYYYVTSAGAGRLFVSVYPNVSNVTLTPHAQVGLGMCIRNMTRPNLSHLGHWQPLVHSYSALMRSVA